MKQLCRILPVLVVALLVLGIGSGVAMAQDVYKVNYFSNNVAGAPDGTVRIDNPGLTYGNLCAMIYVFDADQQLSECCGCVETHNGLRTLSVKRDLTSNPLTGRRIDQWRDQSRIGCGQQLTLRPHRRMYHPKRTCGCGTLTFRTRWGQHIQLPRLNLRIQRWAPPSLRTCRLSAHSSTFSAADRASAVAERGTSCTSVGHALRACPISL